MIEDHIEDYFRELKNVDKDATVELRVLHGHKLIGPIGDNMNKGEDLYEVLYTIRKGKTRNRTTKSRVTIMKKDLEKWVSTNTIAHREERLKKLLDGKG